jgi:hypothetical protein
MSSPRLVGAIRFDGDARDRVDTAGARAVLDLPQHGSDRHDCRDRRQDSPDDHTSLARRPLIVPVALLVSRSDQS